MIWIFLLGMVALFFGALFIALPKSLVRMSEGLNRVVSRIDEQVLKHHIGVGIFLICAGVFIVFSYYFAWRR